MVGWWRRNLMKKPLVESEEDRRRLREARQGGKRQGSNVRERQEYGTISEDSGSRHFFPRADNRAATTTTVHTNRSGAVACFGCGQLGHVIRFCPARQVQQQGRTSASYAYQEQHEPRRLRNSAPTPYNHARQPTQMATHFQVPSTALDHNFRPFQ